MNRANNEPQRPNTVPVEAIWNASENKWELGQKNEQGKHVGEWKWWLAPNGHLVCHVFLDNQGGIINLKRFHPNGEVSEYGKRKNNMWIERVWIRSTEKTTEIFPLYGEENVWKASLVIPQTVPPTYDLYDKEGNHLNGKVNLPVEQFLNDSELETAVEALKRYQLFLEEIKDKSYYHKYELHFSDSPIKFEAIQQLQQRLDIGLPPSYVDFITNHGLFGIGNNTLLPQMYFRLWDLAEIINAKELLFEQYDVESVKDLADDMDLDESTLKSLDNFIAFAQLGEEDYFGFDARSRSTQTNEMEVSELLFEDDEIQSYAEYKPEIIEVNGFDLFISGMIDAIVLDYFEGGN
ncbi:SMI1/KNR4 family protein [Aquimarina litoralis]|uniref:SMI1/KNR4 family protein n=1 Tax=Aquimarina litoralis TaxID=584605 RepID=UPI001C5A2361|nr:SMI1/KNR4 family protein [Aquimarina litoralis]MBW1298474.1 hypothetical protein [Aquimarina litoralis]